MRIKIGEYKDWIGPYQIVDKIFFWHEKYPVDKLAERWDYKLHDKLAKKLADTWVNSVCEWIYSKRQRTIKVKIDRWDTWSADHTLALIILPILKQLKDGKMGAPYVDDEDVPEEIRSTSARKVEQVYDTDEHFFKRWDYVIDEMIWAFEQHVSDDEPNFWIIEPKGMFFEEPKEVEGVGKCSEMKWEVQGEYDEAAATKYHDRKKNGFRLFGKYYQSLWT